MPFLRKNIELNQPLRRSQPKPPLSYLNVLRCKESRRIKAHLVFAARLKCRLESNLRSYFCFSGANWLPRSPQRCEGSFHGEALLTRTERDAVSRARTCSVSASPCEMCFCIYIYLCVYIYMHLCICVCVCVCMLVYTHVLPNSLFVFGDTAASNLVLNSCRLECLESF